jgi:hypothetical protein
MDRHRFTQTSGAICLLSKTQTSGAICRLGKPFTGSRLAACVDKALQRDTGQAVES